jgi:hypothetical protein
MMVIKRVAAIAVVGLFMQSASAQKFEKLFNGKDFNGWYTWMEEYGKNQDPFHVFKIEPGGIIHISGEKFGYLCTSSEFGNFHIKLEFKWGEKKWEPRLTAKRDSGLLYLIPADSVDKIWPCGIECQVQEGDTGDFWMIANPTIVIDGVRTKPGAYIRSVKKKDAEKPNGEWNVVEVIVKDGRCQHFVNGVLVNEGSDASIRKGKLLIQSEGAEVFYRNIEIKKL